MMGRGSSDEEEAFAAPAAASTQELPQPAPPSYPLADAMFQALGEQLDAGEAERELLGHLEEALWTGDWLGPHGGTKKSPQAAKKRLERLLSKATEVRCTYQARLVDEGKISDRDDAGAQRLDERRW